MTKECLELIYSEVKEKSQWMNMWKGSRKTNPGQVFEGLFNEISMFLFTVEAGICHYELYYIRKSPTNLTALTSQYVVLLIFEES